MKKRMENRRDNIPVFDSLSTAITQLFGEEVHIEKKIPVSGGDINDAWCLTLSDRNSIFMKTNSIRNYSFFIAEVTGLSLLRATKCIGVPKVLAYGMDHQGGFSFLLMEYLKPDHREKQYWEIFGAELASLHKMLPEDIIGEEGCSYGFSEDNYIGASIQKNSFRKNWIDFYRECRLAPQMDMAKGYMDSYSLKRFDYLLFHLDQYLRIPEHPSILHGDLWGGNVMAGIDGKAWLIDPAVYLGDPETDLAMTQLFGSFPPAFYEAYHMVYPIDRDFGRRKDIYHLYHMLNHLNLFGRGYLGEVRAILQSI